MLFMAVKYRQMFFNFATMRPDVSKIGGHTKKNYLCSKSPKSAQKCNGIKKTYFLNILIKENFVRPPIFEISGLKVEKFKKLTMFNSHK